MHSSIAECPAYAGPIPSERMGTLISPESGHSRMHGRELSNFAGLVLVLRYIHIISAWIQAREKTHSQGLSCPRKLGTA